MIPGYLDGFYRGGATSWHYRFHAPRPVSPICFMSRDGRCRPDNSERADGTQTHRHDLPDGHLAPGHKRSGIAVLDRVGKKSHQFSQQVLLVLLLLPCKPLGHSMEAYRCWCAAWTSNPVIGANTLDGGFDSHTLPPFFQTLRSCHVFDITSPLCWAPSDVARL